MKDCVHFLESGCSWIELLVRVLVAKYRTFRIQLVGIFLVAPVELKSLLLITISPAPQTITNRFNSFQYTKEGIFTLKEQNVIAYPNDL